MSFSLTSLLTFTICTSGCIALVGFLCKAVIIRQIGIYAFLALCFVTIVRLFFPVEMPFTISIPAGGIYTAFVQAMRKPLFTVGREIAIVDIAVAIWIIGVVIQLIRTIIKNVRSTRVIIDNSTMNVDDATLHNLLRVLNASGYKGDIRLYQSPAIASPFSMGVIKPRIFIPETEMSELEWSYVFKHEVMHFKNHDYLIKAVVELLVVLYWWNPVVYFFRERLSLALEVRVDHMITHDLEKSERIGYLETILKVAKRNIAKRRDIASMTMELGGSGESVLKTRGTLIIKPEAKSRTRKIKTAVASVTAVLISLASFTFVLEPYNVTPDVEEGSCILSDENSYIIVNENNFYDIYIDGSYFCYAEEIPDSFANLRIYENGKVEN